MLMSSATRTSLDRYLEAHLYRVRRTKDQVLNPKEHRILFCPILKKEYYQKDCYLLVLSDIYH